MKKPVITKKGRKKLPKGEKKVALTLLVKGKHKKQAQKLIDDIQQTLSSL